MIIAFTVTLLLGALVATIWQYYFGTVEQTLINRSAVSAATYDKYLTATDLSGRAREIMEYQVDAEIALIQVIDLDGRVVRSSSGFASDGPIQGGSLTTDVTAALAGRTGRWRGRDVATGERVIAVSQPLHLDGRVIGALRYVSSSEDIYRAASQVIIAATAVGAAVVMISWFLSQVLARSIINPVAEITTVAEQLAHGRRDVRATKQSDDELGRLAETLNYLTDELIISEKAKNDFISSISHDLRTPLTAIKGWGETLRAGDLAPDDATMGLGVICGETDRLIGLVEDLLDLSQLQAGQIRIQPEHIELPPLCEAVRQEFSLRAEAQRVALSVDIGPGLPVIDADPHRLKQVLVNVVDNALKFTHEGGAIAIACSSRPGGVRLTVRDTGEGMPPDVLARVTDRFYKGDAKRAGSGLGLSIVSEIVKLHGGQLTVTSEPGRGTQVAIDLPAATAPTQ